MQRGSRVLRDGTSAPWGTFVGRFRRCGGGPVPLGACRPKLVAEAPTALRIRTALMTYVGLLMSSWRWKGVSPGAAGSAPGLTVPRIGCKQRMRYRAKQPPDSTPNLNSSLQPPCCHGFFGCVPSRQTRHHAGSSRLRCLLR